MDDGCDITEDLLDNEREWRRFLIKKVESIEAEFTHISKEIAMMKVWNLMFRLVGGGIFAILLIWIESKLS